MDKVYMKEVDLYAENNLELYRQRFLPIVNNIKRKIKSGKYNAVLAPKLWRYYYDDAAKRYIKEFGGSLLGTKERQELANEKAVEEYNKIINEEYGPIEMKSNPVKRYGSRAKFKHKRLVSPKKFAKKSLRTIKRDRKRIIVGCPKGKYDVKRKVCRVGTRAQAILTAKRNPKETLYFIHAKRGGRSGLYTGKFTLTDQLPDAVHYDDKKFADETKEKLQRKFPKWIWSVKPVNFFEG